MLGCLVHCLESSLLRCLGRLECFFLCLFPSSHFRIHQFVYVIGYVGKTIKEGILCLLADTLRSLAHFLLRGAKSCSKLLTDLLAFFKVALEIKCGLELITYLRECVLGCSSSLLEFALEEMFECITQSLDGSNGVLNREQQHLQDGIANTHNCCNHILECVLVLVGKVNNVVNDLGNPPGKFLNDLCNHIEDRLQGIHSSLECLRCRFVFLDLPRQLLEYGKKYAYDGNDRSGGQCFKSTLESHHTTLGDLESLVKTIHCPGKVLHQSRIVADIPLEIALQGIHILEFVIDIVDLCSKFFKSCLSLLR